MRLYPLLAGPMLLAGCMTPSGDARNAGGDPPAGQVTLRDPAGASRGTGMLRVSGGALMVRVAAEGLPPGDHGIHVHTVGRCDPPAFESAGPHWNPTQRQHGRDNPQGPHGGDMPNIMIGADGEGTLNFTLAGATLAGLMDADGAALVIHASPDDHRTDPSGNSGGRIACGVIEAR